jgi:hypothetical protein
LKTEAVVIEVGPLKSEFAVLRDGVQIFSRFEQRRYPEADELAAICTQTA